MPDIFVFPNPVNQFHDGPITVDGLDYQTTVHITNMEGRLIAVESMGGRAIWDGLLDDGTPAPYGFISYLRWTETETQLEIQSLQLLGKLQQ